MKTYTLTEQAKQLILKSEGLTFEEKNMSDQDFFIYSVDKLKLSWDK